MIGVRSGIDEYGQPAEEILSGYVGEFKYFGFSEVPLHCLACDGSEVSRETYSELFTVFGETFGAGDGATTFNLPDLRGAFLRCIGGNAAALGVQQGDAIRDITGSFTLRNRQSTVIDNIVFLADGIFSVINSSEQSGTVRDGTTSASSQQVKLDVSTQVPTAAENRPVNVAVNICVVYE